MGICFKYHSVTHFTESPVIVSMSTYFARPPSCSFHHQTSLQHHTPHLTRSHDRHVGTANDGQDGVVFNGMFAQCFTETG
jgi:hypothetical protein